MTPRSYVYLVFYGQLIDEDKLIVRKIKGYSYRGYYQDVLITRYLSSSGYKSNSMEQTRKKIVLIPTVSK